MRRGSGRVSRGIEAGEGFMMKQSSMSGVVAVRVKGVLGSEGMEG